ncbi:MAG: DUF2183 domain-containing protein [Chitinophagaceae bacterium]|nr:MAG: DUF2183 domain-containing protein [Chitinophagaceae bacterium]
MPHWKDLFKRSAAQVEERWDSLRAGLNRRLGLNDPIQLLPYRTYGTPRKVYVKGRVLEDKRIASASDKDTVLNNLLNMYKRFESDEVAGATLRLRLGSETHEVTTDREGYFVFDIHPAEPIHNEALWHPVELELLDAPIPHEKGMRVSAEVMIPPADAEYGIISDIDDTVVQTGATSLLSMSRSTFLHNARTRLPYAGVSEFYKALQLGRNGKRNNPFFYVSSSPWNLYDLLRDFLDLNGIPAGPLLLRDFGLDVPKPTDTEGGHMGHKMKEIDQILAMYPQLPFVLVGDSGQEDPAIYREAVRRYPGRILAVYIRDLALPERRRVAVEIQESFKEDKVEMVLTENSVQAAEHAARTGLIFHEALPAVEEDKQQDKGEAPGKEEV